MSLDDLRLSVAARLSEAGLLVEGRRLTDCGRPLLLGCVGCHREKEVPARCMRRYCPVCARIRAADLADRYDRVFARLNRPIFVTWTMAHSQEESLPDLLNRLRGAWRKMRRLRWFRSKVRGGVGAIEIAGGASDSASGWHPHIHSLLDCRWLSVVGGEPAPGLSLRARKAVYQAAQREVAEQWSLCLGDRPGSQFMRRAKAGTTHEVLKYAVSSEAMLDPGLDVSALVEAMADAKLVSPWGTVRRVLRVVRAEEAMSAPAAMCECGCEDWQLLSARGLPPHSCPVVRIERAHPADRPGQYVAMRSLGSAG